ncbi:hypothetical protein RCF44_04765 [Staphylococcus epidermidis]|jgi:hypothetical protein|uniref:hypothetical protein n=1 Tax=Staphylococcus epidermidis TaxID=1282 RepID=UPI00024C2E37|nr:hypothetical protein [Staphylococcus epidermidis]MDU1136112.1 hypothetical protein [Enterococcus faecalis]MDU1160503.1 hypothetical protein [Staphylococcus aureus]MDU1790240.1 hypothetical protein [Streptococcus thermophilus]MDU4436497.1 hypothetical protein [Pluralibacter gergoviae]MDU6976069.1 hypothetical protein [Clostridiales bacterium]
MRKYLYFFTLSIIICLTLVACNNQQNEKKEKTTKETTTKKLQGTWLSDSGTAHVDFGDYIKFKDHNVEVEVKKDSNSDPEGTNFWNIKSFNFKDKKQKHIRFYSMKQGASNYTPANSYIEGTITIKGNKMKFQPSYTDEYWYTFKKK